MTVAQTGLASARPPAMPERLRSLRERLSRSQAGFGYLLAAPALAVVIAALATPIALLVLYSFWTQDYVTVDTTLTLNNYRTILDRPIYFSVMLRSIAISGLVTLLTVLLAYPLASRRRMSTARSRAGCRRGSLCASAGARTRWCCCRRVEPVARSVG